MENPELFPPSIEVIPGDSAQAKQLQSSLRRLCDAVQIGMKPPDDVTWLFLLLASPREERRGSILPSASRVFDMLPQLLHHNGSRLLVLWVHEREFLHADLAHSLRDTAWMVDDDSVLWYAADGWAGTPQDLSLSIPVILSDSKRDLHVQLRELMNYTKFAMQKAEGTGNVQAGLLDLQLNALRRLVKHNPALGKHGGKQLASTKVGVPRPFLPGEKWRVLVIDDKVWGEVKREGDLLPVQLNDGNEDGDGYARNKCRVLSTHFHLPNMARFEHIDVWVFGPNEHEARERQAERLINALRAWPIAEKGRVDAILLDVQLGAQHSYVHGHYLIPMLRDVFDNDPLIIVTSLREDIAIVQESIAVGADLFLAKQKLLQNLPGGQTSLGFPALSDTSCWVGDLPEILSQVRQPIPWDKPFDEVNQWRVEHVLTPPHLKSLLGRCTRRLSLLGHAMVGPEEKHSDHRNEYLHLLLTLFPRATRILCGAWFTGGDTPVDKLRVAVYEGNEDDKLNREEYQEAKEDPSFRKMVVKFGPRWWIRREASRFRRYAADYCDQLAVRTIASVEAGDLAAVAMPSAGDGEAVSLLTHVTPRGKRLEQHQELIRLKQHQELICSVFARGLRTLHAHGPQDWRFIDGYQSREAEQDASLAHQLCLRLPTVLAFEVGDAAPEEQVRINDARIEYFEHATQGRQGWWLDVTYPWSAGQPDKKVRIFLPRAPESDVKTPFLADIMLRPGRICSLVVKSIEPWSLKSRWAYIVREAQRDVGGDKRYITKLGDELWRNLEPRIARFEGAELADRLAREKGVVLTTSYCHGDLHGGNILVSKSELGATKGAPNGTQVGTSDIAWIIDWGACGTGLTAYDYAELEMSLNVACFPRKVEEWMKSQRRKRMTSEALAMALVSHLTALVRANVEGADGSDGEERAGDGGASPFLPMDEVGTFLLGPLELEQESGLAWPEFMICRFANAYWHYWNLNTEGLKRQPVLALATIAYLLITIAECGERVLKEQIGTPQSDTPTAAQLGGGERKKKRDQPARAPLPAAECIIKLSVEGRKGIISVFRLHRELLDSRGEWLAKKEIEVDTDSWQLLADVAARSYNPRHQILNELTPHALARAKEQLQEAQTITFETVRDLFPNKQMSDETCRKAIQRVRDLVTFQDGKRLTSTGLRISGGSSWLVQCLILQEERPSRPSRQIPLSGKMLQAAPDKKRP